ncbi:D-alanyl-D-alanine carboxypeptidase/D-alanyl-D-alanine-endopeptidase [Brasilonema sp. UFV-L1]|uniref:D-alanyl-D-alanine carboxypeptidase/D-alanyl-D-alanine endopeptidase n=1 Tax=Brasilonema sp. UFV-L1 TaxID=2234130 RepID=UPI00145D17EC|nr:D-alanyl-D-alanine carboxypeptidase/D-alanyl-D-alanine-endopeptidase [Brasilonema sp. UFV-L1]NMG09412.1 D-alanyl-D-alanine carboxypeptidase/D-alanyl-D-alanine-endopeptidase [Brasilonema sp. UFV-L1]
MPKKITLGFLLLFFGTQVGITLKPVHAQTQVVPTTTTKPICPAQLETSVDAIINRPLFSRVRWGLLVQPLSSTQTLYSRDAQKYFTPASTTKLLTTAAALQQLGANFRIRTSVYGGGNGVLYVVGRGDPSLTNEQLTVLAHQLKQKGIGTVNQLIADDTYIRGDIVHPSWQWEDIQSDYGAPINSLILNQNVSNIRLLPQSVGQPLKVIWTDIHEDKQWQVINQSVTTAENQPTSINITRDLKGQILRIQGQLALNSKPALVSLPVVSPAEYFLRRFRSTLIADKIPVVRMFLSSIQTKNEQELAHVESPPVSELIAQTNIDSNNLFAESLLRALAIKKTPVQNQNSADAGLEVLKTTLTQMGVDPASYSLVDGSGLSRKNLISPEALVQTLQAMAKSPAALIYRASLPVAGRSGTLKNRFQNTPAEGIVQAKTGTMTGVVSLAGYVNAPRYGPVVFSIMVNQSEQPAKVVRQAMDEIVVLLTQLQNC